MKSICLFHLYVYTVFIVIAVNIKIQALIPLSNQVATINGAGNIVQVTSDNLSNEIYIGKGAGRFPTANSVVNDIVRTYTSTLPAFPELSNSFSFNGDFEISWYIRQKIKKELAEQITVKIAAADIEVNSLNLKYLIVEFIIILIEVTEHWFY